MAVSYNALGELEAKISTLRVLLQKRKIAEAGTYTVLHPLTNENITLTVEPSARVDLEQKISSIAEEIKAIAAKL